MPKKMELLLDEEYAREGAKLRGEYEVTREILHDTQAVAAATVGRQELFGTKVTAITRHTRNVPWDNGQLPDNRGVRIYGIGVSITSEVTADIHLIEYGCVVSINCEDGRRPEKMEPTLARYLAAGGGMMGSHQETQAAAADGQFALVSGAGPAGAHYKIEPAIDIDPGEPLIVVLDVPVALGAISATTNVVVSIVVLQAIKVAGT